MSLPKMCGRTFMDDLAERKGAGTRSYWLPHRAGNHNFAGLLCSDIELSVGLVPTNLKAKSRA